MFVDVLAEEEQCYGIGEINYIFTSMSIARDFVLSVHRMDCCRFGFFECRIEQWRKVNKILPNLKTHSFQPNVLDTKVFIVFGMQKELYLDLFNILKIDMKMKTYLKVIYYYVRRQHR